MMYLSHFDSKSTIQPQMSRFVENSFREIPSREKLDVDTDSDEEALERAVMMHKRNKKQEQLAAAPSAPKSETIENNENQSTVLVNKNTEDCARDWLNGSRSAASDMQHLIKYFITPKQAQKKQQEISGKALSDYEKQGAIPKGKVRDASNDRKKIQAKVSDKKTCKENYVQAPFPDVSLKGNGIKRKSRRKKNNVPETVETGVNSNLYCDNGREKTYSRPFFYIVPEKPSPNFLFPRGSYYVIPKAPDSSTKETVIFHPESCATDSSPNVQVQIDPKDQEVRPNLTRKPIKNMNNLGKDVFQRADSHLNIGPAQIKEESVFNNLEARCKLSKIFEKAIISPEKSSEALDVARKMEETRNEAPKENEELHFIHSEESDVDYSYHHYLVAEGSDNRTTFPNKQSIASDDLHEQKLEDILSVEYLDYKIQQQYERMVRDLPESRSSYLLDKCIEFQGNEEKVVAYIQETQRKTRRQQLITDLQYIFPDADPSYLLEEIEELGDDDNAVNILTSQLLDSQSYPKISRDVCKSRKKLWLDYVKNFDVKRYLIKVPKPEDFAGADGDNNKAEEKLLMTFLFSRYPTASVDYLNQRFNSNRRNITKTCADLVALQEVRLSESTFEHENFDEDFLKEICYIDHREEIDNYLKTVKEMKEIEAVQARLEGAFLYCPLCADDELIASEAVTCPEGDVFCKECIRRYVETKIGDGTYKFACPIEDCQAFFTIPTLEEFLPPTISSIVIKKQQAEEISTAEVDGLEFCRECDFAYIPNPEDKVFKCQNPACLAETCRICHEENHIPLRCEEVEREVDVQARKKIEETMTEKLLRRCPQCGKKFVKIDGCNLITCVCGTKVCYICNDVITGYGHFNAGRPCPLHTNNEPLHITEVLAAGIRVKNEILKENPEIRIVYDPTENSD